MKIEMDRLVDETYYYLQKTPRTAQQIPKMVLHYPTVIQSINLHLTRQMVASGKCKNDSNSISNISSRQLIGGRRMARWIQNVCVTLKHKSISNGIAFRWKIHFKLKINVLELHIRSEYFGI